MNSFILTMGLNHTTAPIRVREHMATAHCTQSDALDRLDSYLDSTLFTETCILSTCNRTEIYAVTSDLSLGESNLRQLFSGHDSFDTSGGDFLYTYVDRDAVDHLFAVASGLDSLVLGESEILGQVRNAYIRAAGHKSLGPILHRLFKDAIHTGKRARSETTIGSGAASVAYAAVALAQQHLGSLRGRTALVIGAGDMAYRAAKNLAQDCACHVTVTNRTLEHAAELAAQVGGNAIPMDTLEQALCQADLVIAATSAPHIVLSAPLLQAAVGARGNRPICLLDISMPRNIDPSAASIPNIQLFNIDDLHQVVDYNRGRRERAVTEVRAIIAHELGEFWQWYAARRAAPIIANLRERAEIIRAAELDKAMRRLEHLHLSERDRQVIAALSAGIVGKLLAAPTVHLKERVQSGDGQIYMQTLRELFELDTDEQSEIATAL